MEKNLEELKTALLTAARGEYKSKLFDKLSMADTVLLDYLYSDTAGRADSVSGKQLKDIADELKISRPALTQQVNKLEARRIIRRVVAQSGKRASYIRFTEYGLKLYESEKSRLERKITSLAEALGEDDCKQLIMLIKKIEDITEQFSSIV